MSGFWSRLSLLASLVVLLFFPVKLAAAVEVVDFELVLAVDCSASVNQHEFDLQMIGLARAFRSEEIINLIKGGAYGGIAVSMVHWSEEDNQQIALPWRHLRDTASILKFADDIDRAARLAVGAGTSITGLIDFGRLMIEQNQFDGARKVIDISADGRNNIGGKPGPARRRALLSGISINGLAILSEVRTLHFYFEQKIIAGPGSFVIKANEYENYGAAIKQKLLKEITPTPVTKLMLPKNEQ